MILSAGIIPVYRDKDQIEVLILRSFNYWDFPKGEVDPGEDPLAAAQRELQEETGIQKIKFPRGHVFTETEPYGKGKIARYYIAEVEFKEVTLGINEDLGHPEHHEYKWATFKEADSLFTHRLQKVLAWAKETMKEQ